MNDYDGVVGIYSPTNVLSEKLKEKFSQKYLDVKVFTDFDKVNLNELSYLILNLIDFKNDFSKIESVARSVECKVLVLHSLFVKDNEKFLTDTNLQNLINSNQNLGVLLAPEILGNGISYNEDFFSHNIIMQSILSERVKLKSDSRLVNTVSVGKLADRIVRDTFSFGISGQKIAIVGPRKSKKIFATKYLNIDEANIINTKEASDIVEVHSTATVKVDFSLRKAVKATRDYLLSTTDTKIEESLIPVAVRSEVRKEKGTLKRKLKRLSKLLIVLIFIALTPFFLLFISVLLLFISSKIALTNNNLASNLITKSSQVANFTKSISFGNNFIYDISNVVYKVGSLGTEGFVLANNTQTFASNIMGNSLYDLTVHSNEISASLDKIHTDISFLQSDVNELDGFVGNYIRNALVRVKVDIGEYKDKIYDVKNLFSRVSVLLGNDRPQKYLILFQNNMELRPTGGFIGSFGLLTFDKGRLSEIVINDVYSADGQLKGHIDPPEPIRKHLGEGGWYLRDSNWDPNFPASALKAEWFLDKEIAEKVDGVIAIDLNFVKKLLRVTGPIRLSDFNMTVDENNLYQLIQSEVEDEFFPGSIKKATILTSLSKALIEEVRHLNGSNYLGFFKEIYESLESRHFQVFLHDNNAQEAISNLNYSGEMDLTTDCGLRCFKDSYSLIDANLGVNKSNYFIERTHELNLSVSKQTLGHELLVNYQNTASPAVGNMGVYKNYARILLPINAKIGGIRQYEANGAYSDLEYDLIDIDGRREVGFLIEVLPSSNKTVQIVWNIETQVFNQGGQYDLKVIKQAGTEEDRLIVNVRSSDLSLTGKSPSSYNTTLGRDFKARMFFKP